MIKFKQISKDQIKEDFKDKPELIRPRRSTSLSAGYDIFNPYFRDIVIKPGESLKIPTGYKIKLDKNKVLFIMIRSSLGFKYNIRLVNQLGVIDADYYNNDSNEGHIWVKIKNEGQKEVVIPPHEAIAQGVVTQYFIEEGDDFEGDVRKGGIGSTNNK